jgi:hypothetical protein
MSTIKKKENQRTHARRMQLVTLSRGKDKQRCFHVAAANRTNLAGTLIAGDEMRTGHHDAASRLRHADGARVHLVQLMHPREEHTDQHGHPFFTRRARILVRGLQLGTNAPTLLMVVGL